VSIAPFAHCALLARCAPKGLAAMPKSVATGAGLAAATAFCGTYQAAKLFVPGVAGQRDVGAALRGTASFQAMESAAIAPPAAGGMPLALGLAGAAGAFATVAAALRTSASSRRPRAAPLQLRAEAAVAGEAAPPPPFDPAKQMGVTDPLGFFDPLGFSKVGDEEGFRKLRIAELKHGRVAMMAAVGAVVQHYLQFPGFDKVPKGLFAVTDGQGAVGFAALFAVSGALELLLWKEDPSKPVSSIGDYGNPLQLGVGEPLGESEGMRNRELNNGRAAMFAILGIMVAELATGKDGMQQMGFS